MEITEMRVRLTMTDPVLGMAPQDAKLYETYIASKSPDAETIEEEIERVGAADVAQKGMTVFPRTADGRPMVWDYQIRGFFKDAMGMLKRVPGSKTAEGAKAHKKIVDGLIFIKDRENPFEINGEIGTCQRPLRASTPQGEQVAIAASEMLPAGSTLTFTIWLLDPKLAPIVRECLDYGRLRGICQWRNSGKGRFTWEELK